MKYKAVVFDLDGTLLDTLDDLADSMNEVLEAENMPTHPVDSYRTFVGDGVVELVRRALPEDHRRDEELVAHMVNRMRDVYSRRWDAKTKPYDGVDELLDGMEKMGIGKAVLSNKPHDFTRLCVSKLLPGRDFDVVLGVSETVPPKPDATGLRQITEQLKLTPRDFLYLGDTNTDMTTAVAAGMFPVGAGWGFRSREELLGNGAAVVCDDPREVLALLNGKG
jgi:phosphoglycolate phosphatase